MNILHLTFLRFNKNVLQLGNLKEFLQ